MSELKAFDVGLGQYCKDGSPCVVAFDTDRNPRLLNEKVYLKSEADKVIAELKDKSEKLETELHALQNKMCEDAYEGIAPSHITCPPLRYAAYITNRTRRNYYLALVRAAETGRRFWVKEQLFAMREGRKKDSEKAWKMEKRRERQVRVFTAKAMEVKI